MTAAASDGGAQRRIARAAGAEARQRHHQHRITQAQLAAAPAELLLGPKRRVRLVRGRAPKR